MFFFQSIFPTVLGDFLHCLLYTPGVCVILHGFPDGFQLPQGWETRMNHQPMCCLFFVLFLTVLLPVNTTVHDIYIYIYIRLYKYVFTHVYLLFMTF